MELKILSFNIHHGKGLDKRVNLGRIANIIKRSKADIIGLNEVDVSFGKRSQFLNQAAILAEQLEMEFVFGPVITRKKSDKTTGEYGNVLLSRIKMRSHENHLLYSHSYLAEPRGLLEVNFEISGKVISAFVTHLSINPFLQRKQIMDIETIVQRKSNVILMGDFNMSPVSRNHSYIGKILKDSSETESGYTYPANKPRKKLDYIFIQGDITVVESKVVTMDPVASDHLPLLTKIIIDE
ncbi:endonuclease/exonuclease/phosphatase family protein [Bacillus luteolus]|uniref:Endonuclease/exonuclease/phosphatase family protein n=1 Tax=Litchfieldia luteola TaxID=682179 RepID=A0ABR9QNB4_9BACI|nr:endonuclease/exonuclease/phosphatase family protein [Cytobacillus luteolus]MBE4909995.1 endonuclease/exonuclease/phosphatase family protein [Cytobacillus luteolus]MBP1942445.1 endonuclease/exonuclease/phosphatase family metal-dependent hydrolase [Cytobacillus luteolus]